VDNFRPTWATFDSFQIFKNPRWGSQAGGHHGFL
jgi:hypothetical protein